MLLTHVCPICGRDHEKDCTPEPNQPCNDCSTKKFISDKRDPAERGREAQEIMKEMQICPRCKEVGPCGCPNPNAPDDVDPRFMSNDGRQLEKGIDTT